MWTLSTSNVAYVHIERYTELSVAPKAGSGVEKYHHGNLKAVLLRAAFHLVGKTGIESFTLREVARRAGVSHNAPYRHFRSKEDLMAALAAEAFVQLHDALQQSLTDSDETSAKVRSLARAYLYFALENPARFNVMFHSAFDREEYPDYIAAYQGSWKIFSELLHNHSELAYPVETACELLWANIHGIAELGLAKRLRHGESAELQQLADTAVDAVMAGLRAPRKARTNQST
jgi:AcrR family transcriptional regulator